MSKFNDVFSRVFPMTGEYYALSRIAFDRTKAESIFKEHFNGYGNRLVPFIPRAMSEHFVRFGFPPDGVEDREDFDGPVWYTTSIYKKCCQPIWLYDGAEARYWYWDVVNAIKENK